MLKLIIVFLILGLTACNQPSSKRDTKTLDFGLFTIETPNSWTKIKERGADSYVGRIAIDGKDTLDFDLGWHSNKLYETDVTMLDSSMINSIDTSAVDINSIIFVKDKNLVDPDKYRKNNISWDSIGGYRAKIVYPRQSGIGITGVYIDSLWQAGSGVARFNLYGTNLKPDNEKKVLEFLRTLKFHKK
ncbi:MAG: hypothetical protein JWQ09_5543 [Segetibacter sp.]|nr:hypothetical protein [Segetibacter sp.]